MLPILFTALTGLCCDPLVSNCKIKRSCLGCIIEKENMKLAIDLKFEVEHSEGPHNSLIHRNQRSYSIN